jgi:hypothetical protein
VTQPCFMSSTYLMKTIYPIILSFGLLIPFSPVGEYLWHHSQEIAANLTTQTQSNGQSWWQSVLSAQDDLSSWFMQSKTRSWQQIDAQTETLKETIDQQGTSLQQSLHSSQTLVSNQWQRGQQTLQQQGSYIWHETTLFVEGIKTSIEAVPQAYWSSHGSVDSTLDVDADTADLNTLSLAANHPEPAAN